MIVEKGWFLPTLQFGPDDVFLFEDWDETPAGPYRAIFHFDPGDHRTLYASSEGGRDLVSGIHRFDEMHVVDIYSVRDDGDWSIETDTGDKGLLRIDVRYRETPVLKIMNPVACHTPEFIARNSIYCRLLPRVAAPLLGTDPDQRMSGVTELGRKTRFRMDRLFKVTDARCTWGERDLGALMECCFGHQMGDYGLVSKAVASQLSLFVE